MLRALGSVDPGPSERYGRTFDGLLRRGEVDAVIGLADDALAPNGGPLFEGFRAEAPPSWRSRHQFSAIAG
jgi:hypothetical protein